MTSDFSASFPPSQTRRLRFLLKFEHEAAVGGLAASKFFSGANKSKGDF
jgi:hypothetical protein